MSKVKSMIDPLSSTSAAPFRRSRLWIITVVAALLAVHFTLAVGSKRNESTTSDEILHLTAGFSYWHNHDYRLHPENGILPQRWAALPTWLADATFPSLKENEYWRYSEAVVIGHQFFYETGEDHFPRLMAARAMIALFSAATGLLVFYWARKLFGTSGALVSLSFFVFSPSFLAHGALATSDACMAFFFLAATGAWWRHLHDSRGRTWWLCALILGLAFVSKYSAILLIPMMIVMACIRAFADAPLVLGRLVFSKPLSKFCAATVSALAQGVVVAGVIWAFYGFRYTAFNPHLPPASHFIKPWADFERTTGLAGKIIHAAASLHALPEAFLYGFSYVLETTKSRGAFLNGDYSLTGWPTFFPWAFLLKTTVPVLLASALTMLIALRRWRQTGSDIRRDLYRLTPLLTLFVVYWVFSITSNLNIGHRHILPTYPVLYIAFGALGAWIVSRRWLLIGALAGLLGWHVVSTARIAPHFIAYFNELGGGPDQGYRHLVDSSLDWGQDLPGLKKWLVANAGKEPVFLSYFGTGEPAYYDLDAHRLHFLNGFKFPVTYTPLSAGVYAVSATILQQVYSPMHGPWTQAREREYQLLRAAEPTFTAYASEPIRRSELERELSAERWQQLINQHELLRLARLCHYLRARKPDAKIGYSIFIYRLSATEIADATAGPLSKWATLIEAAALKNP
jgi:hypothetical protein